jgi:hypothetical protein
MFVPQIEGTVAVHSPPDDFRRAFQRRVEAGLLSGRKHPRSHYQTIDNGPAALRVRAADWWTAINVGLNELELTFPEHGSVRYRVRYWRWALYAIGLAGVMGSIGIVLLLALDVRGYIVRHEYQMLPGLSPDQSLLLAWVMVLFWGFAWPWLLVALHKRPLRNLVARLIGEVDAAAGVP